MKKILTLILLVSLISCKKKKVELTTPEPTSSKVSIHYQTVGSTNTIRVEGKLRFNDVNDNQIFLKELSLNGSNSKASFDTTFTTQSNVVFGEAAIYVFKSGYDLDTQCDNLLTVSVDGTEVFKSQTFYIGNKFKVK